MKNNSVTLLILLSIIGGTSLIKGMEQTRYVPTRYLQDQVAYHQDKIQNLNDQLQRAQEIGNPLEIRRIEIAIKNQQKAMNLKTKELRVKHGIELDIDSIEIPFRTYPIK